MFTYLSSICLKITFREIERHDKFIFFFLAILLDGIPCEIIFYKLYWVKFSKNTFYFWKLEDLEIIYWKIKKFKKIAILFYEKNNLKEITDNMSWNENFFWMIFQKSRNLYFIKVSIISRDL